MTPHVPPPIMPAVNEALCEIFGLTITGWKLVGYAGVLMFGSRWVVQVIASRKARRPVVPAVFWLMSMAGSLMCLGYFIFGKNDSVGVLGYLFPSAVAGYNLYLDVSHKRRNPADADA